MSKRPFHETIVDVINSVADPKETEMLRNLIVMTKIPKNHDNIAVAWRRLMTFLCIDDTTVLNDLQEQKKEAEAKAAAQKVADEQRVRELFVQEFEV